MRPKNGLFLLFLFVSKSNLIWVKQVEFPKSSSLIVHCKIYCVQGQLQKLYLCTLFIAYLILQCTVLVLTYHTVQYSVKYFKVFPYCVHIDCTLYIISWIFCKHYIKYKKQLYLKYINSPFLLMNIVKEYFILIYFLYLFY